MKVIILTPVRQLYRGIADAVKVPGLSGQFEILKGHANIVSGLGKGVIYVTEEGGNKVDFNIKQGFVEVLRDQVSVLVTTEGE